MNGNGFDWLHLPQAPPAAPDLHASSGTTSPAPPVSFGVSGNSNVFQLTNKAADSILHKPQAAPASGTVQSEAMSSLENDLSVPLSLTAQDLTLEESRTYIRWYSDILARTNTRTITMNDVYNFLNNFKLSAQLKEQINRMFHKFLNSINIGEFFALLRLISHALMGEKLHRKLIRYHAPIPTPPSILSKKRQSDDDNDDYEIQHEEQPPPAENKQLDLDSFTQFMLTGQRPDETPRKRKKKPKSVKFSDQIVTDIHDSQGAQSPVPASPTEQLDYSLPMDQLLRRLSQQQSRPMSPNAQPDEEEQQILKDMESQINHFQNLHNVDTASIGGVPAPLNQGDLNSEQLLHPNMTGPAQMSQYIASRHDNASAYAQSNQRLSPTPLKPNMTGPYDMMKIFSPSPTTDSGQQEPMGTQGLPHISLQSFANEMTGNTAANTLANAHMEDNMSLTNSNMPNNTDPGRFRSTSLPTIEAQRVTSPTFFGNGSSSRNGTTPPPPPPPPARGWSYNANGKSAGVTGGAPPPPPPPRRRGQSFTSSPMSPPPLPGKEPIDPTVASDSRSNSTANILDDLKALQAEVDKIRDMTGGF